MTMPASIPDVELYDALEALGLSDAELISSQTRATDTRVWQVSHIDRLLAIRVYRQSQVGAMRTELQAMRLASQYGIPVPGVVSTGIVTDTFPAMAIDWLPGNLVGEVLMQCPFLAQALGRSAGRLLARLHQIPKSTDPEAAVLSWDWIRRAGEVDDWLREQLESSQSMRASLLHLDFHPHNLMTTGSRVTGVLDWTNGVFGDPRADVAHAVTLMRVVAPAVIASRGAHRMAIGVYTRSFLNGYEATTAGKLRSMAPFYAWAGQVIHRDLASKGDGFPLSDSDKFLARIERWKTDWLNRAKTGPASDKTG